MRWIKKIISENTGVYILLVGVLILVISYFIYNARVKDVMLISGLLLVIAGILSHVIITKKLNKY